MRRTGSFPGSLHGPSEVFDRCSTIWGLSGSASLPRALSFLQLPLQGSIFDQDRFSLMPHALPQYLVLHQQSRPTQCRSHAGASHEVDPSTGRVTWDEKLGTHRRVHTSGAVSTALSFSSPRCTTRFRPLHLAIAATRRSGCWVRGWQGRGERARSLSMRKGSEPSNQ